VDTITRAWGNDCDTVIEYKSKLYLFSCDTEEIEIIKVLPEGILFLDKHLYNNEEYLPMIKELF